MPLPEHPSRPDPQSSPNVFCSLLENTRPQSASVGLGTAAFTFIDPVAARPATLICRRGLQLE